MAFVKRTWLARIGIGLNKFLIGTPDSQGRQTLTSSPDIVSQEGDVISADNLNDLEQRIENAFGEVVPKTTTVNEKALTGNITLNASDVGAVPTTRTVNGKALSSDISLTASDVGAVAVDDTGWVEWYNNHAPSPTIVKYRRLNGFVTVIGINFTASLPAEHALPQNCRPVQTIRFFVPTSSSTSSAITSGYRLVEYNTDGRLIISTGTSESMVTFNFTFPAG